jgi:hypothetical protein
LVKVESGKPLYSLLYGLFFFGFNHHSGVCLLLQSPRPTAVNPVTTDFHKPMRQDVQAKPSQELNPCEFNRFLLGSIAVILVHKGYSIIVYSYNPVIGNGNTVRVLPKVLHHMFGLPQ